ncbi:MAG: ERCC4 domain-containing protein [Lachnospiraceae bacterium]|nr:ERCC4 domain-containing protein [Lachnospiraceae bacterium]
MRILVDTREQDTKLSKSRYESFGVPYRKEKLNAGDYSCECDLPGGEVVSLKDQVVIERKYALDELCMCFGKDRQRFKKEFERAQTSGTRVYLLVENATWEHVLTGKYRSQYNPIALTSSLLAWQVRYDMRIVFCKTETSGVMIKNILYRELKERLQEV